MLSIVEESDGIYTVHPPLATVISIAIALWTHVFLENKSCRHHFYYNMTKENRGNR